nr:single minded 2 [Hymenolepis microstoma]
MRSSAWNQYLTSTEFHQHFQVDQNGYYIPPAYIQEYKRYRCHCGSDHQNLPTLDPLIEYPYSNDSAFVPIEAGSNRGISRVSEADSTVISNSDGASVCHTLTATREKSKNAARMRRSNENCEYKELSHYLPLPSGEKIVLDKASSIRLTTNFLKMRALLSPNYSFVRRFVIRIKCLLTKSKNSLSCEGFKAMHFEGHIKAKMVRSNETLVKQVQYLIGIAHTLPVVSRISMEVKLSRDMFMFRAGLDLKLSYVDDQIEFLTGYLPKNVMEKSLYDLIHCGDAEEVAEGHKTHKGQVIFKLFRLLCLNGGWIWVQAYAIILRGSGVSKPDFIVGFANALTGIQAVNMKFDVCQLSAGSEISYENEIVPNKARRKRRCPAFELGEDSAPESYSISDAVFTERFSSDSDHYNPNNRTMNFNWTHYHKAHERTRASQGISNDTAHSEGNFPPSLVVQGFMEQLSIKTSTNSTSHGNWLYPLHFHQQY